MVTNEHWGKDRMRCHHRELIEFSEEKVAKTGITLMTLRTIP